MTVSDLNPDALARLEAKLIADLEVLRKVRALLEEHQIAFGSVAVPPSATPAPSVVAAEAPPPAAAAVPVAPLPQAPGKSYEEIFTECLMAMPPEGFNLGVLKQALRKAGVTPSDSRVKQGMNRLIRHGKMVVVKSEIGRIGNTYRYAVPFEESASTVSTEAATAPTDAETAGQSAAN